MTSPNGGAKLNYHSQQMSKSQMGNYTTTATADLLMSRRKQAMDSYKLPDQSAYLDKVRIMPWIKSEKMR
jgi:hypothetical protein